MPQTTIVIQLTKTIVKATLVESIRNGTVDFVTDQTKGLSAVAPPPQVDQPGAIPCPHSPPSKKPASK